MNERVQATSRNFSAKFVNFGVLVVAMLGICSFVDIGKSLAEVEPAARKRALLIGVGQYPHLPEALQLRGPPNDVRLLQHVLESRLNFATSEIALLTDDLPAESLPTRDNIVRELRRLGNEARKNDEILIYFSGHGTQQPDNPLSDAVDAEADGMDEVLCARDVRKITVQDGREIPGGIVDDEIAVLLDAPLRAGANVWMIIDSCHSGTAVRGDETVRGIPPDEFLSRNILADAKVTTRGAAALRDPLTPSLEESPDGEGRLVVLYAAQANEPTVEKRLPRSGPERKPHGLLTFSLTEVLSTRPPGFTYRDVIDDLSRRYVEQSRTSPSPWMEGTELHRSVFGHADIMKGRQLRLTIDRRGRTIATAGSLDGLTPGTVLAVMETADASPRAHVRVVEANLFESVVEPFCINEKDTPATPPVSGVLRVVSAGRAPTQLRIHLTEEFVTLIKALEPIHVWPSGVEVTESLDDGDLQVCRTAQEWRLQTIDDRRVIARWNSASYGATQLSQLDAALSGQLRVRRLMALSTVQTPPVAAGLGAILCSLRTILFDDVRDRTGKSFETGDSLRNGQIVAFEVVNSGSMPIDVTLLLVDSSGRLQPVFPARGREGDARLPAGKSLRTPRAVVEVTEAGTEHLVLIAVAAEGPPQTFAWAAEEPDNWSTTSSKATRGSSGSGTLLREALLGSTTTRGSSTGEMLIRGISWRTLP